MSTQDDPIALRALREFPPARGSVWDDPADEKSAYQSQRFDRLKTFYAGRQPSWYGSAVRPLRGCRRVLDLGAGPGLALKELLNQGAQRVVGIDRWPGFKHDAPPSIEIVLHDLTLPMPFLAAGSFDGVLSHFVLDFISPVGLRQALREAHRLLEPGGRIALYVAAIGLAGNNEVRTSPYGLRAMRDLLFEAGFVDIDLELSPNSRNTIAKAKRSATNAALRIDEAAAPVHGDTQITAAFEATSGSLTVDLRGTERAIALQLATGASTSRRVSCCARIAAAPHGAVLEAWVWRGADLVASQSLCVDFEPTSIQVRCDGHLEELDTWSPCPFAIEPAGDAFVLPGRLRAAGEMNEVARGQEGRRILIADEPFDRPTARRILGDIKSRFVARRVLAVGLHEREQEWRERRLDALVFTAKEFAGPTAVGEFAWAAQRGIPVLVEGRSWADITSAVEPRVRECVGPLVLVDPLLSSESYEPLPTSVLSLARSADHVYLLLAAGSRQALSDLDREALRCRLLAGSGSQADALSGPEEDEALRYLTERAILMRLRHISGREPSEIGRRTPMPGSMLLASRTAAAVKSCRARPEIRSGALVSPDPGRSLPMTLPPSPGFSAHGSPAPTTIFLTVDVEDSYFRLPRLMTGDGVGRDFGVYGILDELEARGMRGTFFVNVYESERQQAGAVEAVVRDIHERGHEVGLHAHPAPELAKFNRPLFWLSADEQFDVFRSGIDRIQKWTGGEVTSFRAGGYSCNEATFEALAKAGIKLDSSCFFQSPNNHVVHAAVNAIHRRGDVIEVPVTSVLRLGQQRQLEHRKLDPDWLSPGQLLASIRRVSENGSKFAMVMMHSFTCIEKQTRKKNEPRSERAIFTSDLVLGCYVEIYGPKQQMRTNLAAILDGIAQSSTLRVSALRDSLSELNLALKRGVPDVVPIVPES
jgi:peptidoglycan/xylan/chitin deacetylase (PgdA/CDA1 family)/SAM-dependent methyltransferase